MIEVQQLARQFLPQRAGLWPGLRRGGAHDLKHDPAHGPVRAVQDVSFHAPDGFITGLLGPNGAGKTTTLRMLAGLIMPDAGRLRVDGIDVVARPREALARLGVLSDARGLYPRLSARENIVYHGSLHGMPRDAAHARAETLARMLDMVPLLERRTDGFSQGERMKTALARALVHDPANIVLDEPTNGLDVLATRALREALRFLRSAEGGGKCIVFSSHIMSEVERVCDAVVVVARGRTVAAGTVAQLLQQTGEADFEEAFVKLAFQEGGSRAHGRPHASPPTAVAAEQPT
jgi:sodium transport system ATP-binding protein